MVVCAIRMGGLMGRGSFSARTRDDDAFRRVVEQTLRVAPMPIGAYGRLPNHGHFVVRPERAGDLCRFMQRITTISMPWCDTSSGMRCVPGSSSMRKAGDGEACINGHAKQARRCWAIGPCRNRPTGRSRSTPQTEAETQAIGRSLRQPVRQSALDRADRETPGARIDTAWSRPPSRGTA